MNYLDTSVFVGNFDEQKSLEFIATDLDTSVFGGYFDEEFKEFTIPLFKRVNDGEFKVLLSAVLQRELKPAPEKIISLITGLKRDYTEFVDEDDDVISLATEYITEQVVGQTSFADCLHIALATINQADVLISWNFKHVVNIERICGYNSVNINNWIFAHQEN